MVQHILFPTDGSEASRKALQYLKSFASKMEAKVSLLHTYEFNASHLLSRYSVETSYSSEVEAQMKTVGERLLAEVAQELQDASVSVADTLCEKGDAGAWIIKTAEDKGIDLILMGTRGLGGVSSALLGSSSHYVLNHSHHIPVLTVPNHK